MRRSCSSSCVLSDATSTSRRSLFSLSWLMMRFLLSSASVALESASSCSRCVLSMTTACSFSSSERIALVSARLFSSFPSRIEIVATCWESAALCSASFASLWRLSSSCWTFRASCSLAARLCFVAASLCDRPSLSSCALSSARCCCATSSFSSYFFLSSSAASVC